MTDFCYMANALLIIFLAFLPQNDYLFKACFFFANGSLAVAVGAFRNQMVFHKYDNLTSLALHIFPQVTTWNLRWSTMPQEVGVAEELRRVTELDTTFSFKKFYLVPVSIYMVWVSIYFIINFVVAAKRIRKRNYDNMFLLYEKKEWAQKIMYKFGAGMAPFIFISAHMVFFILCHCFSILCFYSFEFHTFCIVFWLTWSVWNGSCFYMDYFSKKYEQSLQRMELVEQQLNEDK
uniref:Glycerophosphocholine acyltransferase 1 n=1 Tax=Strombidium rassoulzadegani TaxID=1082188 RepID=A0A7S3CMA4_9SPIT|mmetsp:Transcript_1723/g.3050  ORF Transcript_1723/g.3050 Transcript_1723/m.3050 type:complete len:234 (+) Transcript_1723:1046-1747(+)